MTSEKRPAAICLLGGLALAVGTPAYVAHAAPSLAAYLQHPAVWLIQSVPYLVFGAVWLPWKSARTDRPARMLAILLLVTTVAVYAPILWAPAAYGGDMVALAYLTISAGMTLFVLLASAIAGLFIWRNARRSRGWS